jgi:hypothetical protein
MNNITERSAARTRAMKRSRESKKTLDETIAYEEKKQDFEKRDPLAAQKIQEMLAECERIYKLNIKISKRNTKLFERINAINYANKNTY